MQFTINRDAVLDTVAHVARRAKRGAIPILGHILLTAIDQSVSLGGHDGNASGSGEIDADVQETGACVVPGEQFLGIIERMPEGAQVKLKYDENSPIAEITS